MQNNQRDIEQLSSEHQILLLQYARIQGRCNALLRQRTAEIDRLRAQAMQRQAAIIVRDTALAWEREDRAEMEASIPGLPRRLALTRRIRALSERLRDLLRERTRWQLSGGTDRSAASQQGALHPAEGMDATAKALFALQALDNQEACREAANLVICQTGCLSHGAYWRIEDHCKRTGHTCVMVAQPEAVRFVRFEAQASPERDEINTKR